MTRSNAREIACHLVYEMNFNGISADEAMNLLMDPEYYPALEAFIEKNAIGWSLDRISKVAVAVMEVAMYECEHADDVPTAAAISEAVELTRKYEDEDVVSFVNGILGKFSREGLAQ